ncbi:MAG TPA: hypothetical protein VK669_11365 [Candidatus Limnocylindrales bacterium]|nr:hypothetical protein [Candidatus Limnocylindrales bacterium]
MRYAVGLLALAFIAASFRAAGAQAVFADSICPEASQYVIAAGKIRRDDPPQRVYDAAQAVTNAYERCSKSMLSNGFREPQHYADTRAAQFAVVAARALIAMNRLDDARRELNTWRPYAQQVVDWRTETEAFASADVNGSAVTNAGDHRQSRYHDSAKEIVAAIDVELARIDVLSRH